MAGKLEILRTVPIFAGLAEPKLEAILTHFHEKTFLKGENLWVEGEPSKGLWVVWKGTVKIYKLGEGGREQILAMEGPGRTVAELPLLDGLPYPASCAAMEDAIVLNMPPSTFHRLVESEPAIARAVIGSLAMRLRRMVALVQELSLKAVRERLAGLLLELAEENDTFELHWNNQEIAARLGTVREIVSRTLSRMVHEGAIEMNGRQVRILDRARL
jgi:CRP/FNR family transcriptional regulator